MMKKLASLITVLLVLPAMPKEPPTNLVNAVYSESHGGWVGIDLARLNPNNRQEMENALPYPYEGDSLEEGNGNPFRLCTIGQISKMCDYAAVGKVVSVVPDKSNDEYQSVVTFTLNVEAVLFGDMPIPHGRFFPSRKISVTGLWVTDANYESRKNSQMVTRRWGLQKRPKPGDRLLVFLSSEQGDDSFMVKNREHELQFDFQQKEPAQRGVYYLARAYFGARHLNTPEKNTSYLEAAKGYLKELRGGERDAESYYALLRRLAKSPVERIREDARSDLMMLIQHGPPSFFFRAGSMSCSTQYLMASSMLSSVRTRLMSKDGGPCWISTIRSLRASSRICSTGDLTRRRRSA
jgi:hypothetical protein